MSANESLRLSTGHEVALPLETEARIDALVVSADATESARLLSPGLDPVRLWPGRTALVFLSVAYGRIGDDALTPYDEFGVGIAATPTEAANSGSVSGTRRGGAPWLDALGQGVGGSVLTLPVTTAPACALGVEGWGYPKCVADISIRAAGSGRRTTVSDDDGQLATVVTRSTPRIPTTASTASFTAPDAASSASGRAESADAGDRSGPSPDGLRRQPLGLAGRVGARPFAGHVVLGDHPLANRLRKLRPGRALASLSFEGTFTIHPNEDCSG